MSEYDMAKEYEKKQGVINRERRNKAKRELRAKCLSFMEIFRVIKEINSDLKPEPDGKMRIVTVHLPLKMYSILDSLILFELYSTRGELIRNAIISRINKALDNIGVTPEERREIWR